jgi:hypothetical protein
MLKPASWSRTSVDGCDERQAKKIARLKCTDSLSMPSRRIKTRHPKIPADWLGRARIGSGSQSPPLTRIGPHGKVGSLRLPGQRLEIAQSCPAMVTAAGRRKRVAPSSPPRRSRRKRAATSAGNERPGDPAQMAGALPVDMSATGKPEHVESPVRRARGRRPSAADSLSDSFSLDRSP